MCQCPPGRGTEDMSSYDALSALSFPHSSLLILPSPLCLPPLLLFSSRLCLGALQSRPPPQGFPLYYYHKRKEYNATVLMEGFGRVIQRKKAGAISFNVVSSTYPLELSLVSRL